MVNNPARRSLDMADIEYLLREHRDNLDLEMIREYFDLFQQGKELDKILERIKDVKR